MCPWTDGPRSDGLVYEPLNSIVSFYGGKAT